MHDSIRFLTLSLWKIKVLFFVLSSSPPHTHTQERNYLANRIVPEYQICIKQWATLLCNAATAVRNLHNEYKIIPFNKQRRHNRWRKEIRYYNFFVFTVIIWVSNPLFPALVSEWSDAFLRITFEWAPRFSLTRKSDVIWVRRDTR